MSRYRLSQSARATADASGKAVARLGPDRAFETWQIRTVTVQSTSSTLVPQARVYRNHEAVSALLGGSHTGTLDTAQTDTELRSGESLVVVWTGADAGAECTVTVEGESVR